MALIKCPDCGKNISDQSESCLHCGMILAKKQTGQCCPKCGSANVDTQVFQENQGSGTISRTKTKYKQKGHGCLWWLFIGWWWWIIDLFLWIFLFFPRLILRLFAAPFKRKKYTGTSTTVSATKNKIKYKTVFLCKSCGERWEK